jgi:Flp pilus assembly protein TadD
MSEADKQKRKLAVGGLRALQRKDYKEAGGQFRTLVTLQPDWEHGEAYYNLACCLEELGRFRKARRAYLRAVQFQPNNPIYLEGLASFLYLHGAPGEALWAHMKLLEVGTKRQRTQSRIVLLSLGKRLGISKETLSDAIQSAAVEATTVPPDDD